jgi:hypothetical protein
VTVPSTGTTRTFFFVVVIQYVVSGAFPCCSMDGSHLSTRHPLLAQRRHGTRAVQGGHPAGQGQDGQAQREQGPPGAEVRAGSSSGSWGSSDTGCPCRSLRRPSGGRNDLPQNIWVRRFFRALCSSSLSCIRRRLNWSWIAWRFWHGSKSGILVRSKFRLTSL